MRKAPEIIAALVTAILMLWGSAGCGAADRELIIGEVFYDTPLNESAADDSPRYNGEYVKLLNVSSIAVDLSGYGLEFKANKEAYRYEFPDMSSLPTGGVAIVYHRDDGGFSFEELFTEWVGDELHQTYYQNDFYMSNTKGELKLLKDGAVVDIVEYGAEAGIEAKNGEGRPVDECVAVHRDFYYAESDGRTFYLEEYSRRIADPHGSHIERKGVANDGYLGWVFDEYRPGTTRQNFVAKAVPTEPVEHERHMYEAVETVEYFDGLGRSLETVEADAGGDGGDVAARREYDGMGNVAREFIPVPAAGAGNGIYVDPDGYASSAAGFYGAETPYREYFYESTAAPCVTERVAEGTAWHSHGGATTEYFLNTASGELTCARYVAVESPGGTALEKDGNYGVSQLRVVKTKDEDGVTTLTFTDLLGRDVLVRQAVGGGYADTYYVYDNYGRLAFVLPPELSERLKSRGGTTAADDVLMDKYAFVCEYDHRNRRTGKKLPGADWVRMAYDNSDLLIASEDGNQRREGRHTVYAYDRLGRQVYSAEIDGAIGGADAGQGRTEFDTAGLAYGYGSPGERVDREDVLMANYYDNYGFLDMFPGIKAELAYRQKSGCDSRFVSPTDDRSSALGLLTGRLTACGDSVTVEAFYYDHAGRVVQRHATNHLGGFEHVYLALSFTGNPVRELREHTPGDGRAAITVLKEYEYDGRDRLTKVTHRIGGGETMVLLKNSYDGVGRLAATEMNGGSYRTGYSYNVRGWTESVESEWFGQRLYYKSDMAGTPRFNGNISMDETTYTQDKYGENKISFWRRHTYDGMNRLVSSAYSKVAARTSPVDRPVIYVSAPRYSTCYGYDLNSNIVTLRRDGLVSSVPIDNNDDAYRQWTFGTIDSLVVALDGNRITKVSDGAGEAVYGDAFDFRDGADEDVEYGYDANGNMTSDSNSGITSIEYDTNNLPRSVVIGGTSRNLYTYDASGRKLRAVYQINPFAAERPGGEVRHDTVVEFRPPIGGGGKIRPMSSGGLDDAPHAEIDPLTRWRNVYTRDYCGDIIYKDGEIERILTYNGYAVPNVKTGGYDYYYYVKDYQGNIRMVLDEENNIMESNGYYPYGMPYADNYYSVQPYKYGSKELDRTNGLDLYDFSARWYDMTLPRFLSLDPLCEKYPSISPYAYCAGNPVRYVDYRGDSISLASIQKLDHTLNSDFTSTIISELNAITGLSLTVSSDGILTYDKQNDGNTEGSITARNMLIDAIENKDMVSVMTAHKSASPIGTNEIWLGIGQINNFMNGSSNVNKLTLGWGMTFLHELLHTNVGGALQDFPYNPGPVVEIMNTIRSELNGNFGQRMQYKAKEINGSSYLPFDALSDSFLRNGLLPHPNSMFIKF